MPLLICGVAYIGLPCGPAPGNATDDGLPDCGAADYSTFFSILSSFLSGSLLTFLAGVSATLAEPGKALSYLFYISAFFFASISFRILFYASCLYKSAAFFLLVEGV